MKISILGWEYENIRRMENLKISLIREGQEVYANTLIMMPNGTGKTTTLHLIRAVLSGQAERWRDWEVRSYRPSDLDISEGRFVLRISFDGDIYVYVLHLNYEEGRAWYETGSAMLSGGLERGRSLPRQMRRVLEKEEFVNRFIFDGEQARKTLTAGSREAEDAIVYLYQLNRLDELAALIDRLAADNQERNAGGATERSVKVFRTKMDRRERLYRDLLREKESVAAACESEKSKRQEYEQTYRSIVAQDQRLQDEQERLNREKERVNREISETTESLMNSIRKPYNLQMDIHQRLKNLVENMQVLKLPKTTAREFFKELAVSRECVCGRCIGAKEKESILRKADEYLGQDSLIVVNAIKGALNEYEPDAACEDRRIRLLQLLQEEHDIEGAMGRLTLDLSEQGRREILQVREKIEQANARIEEYETRLLNLTTTDYVTYAGLNPDNNIPLAEKAWKEAKDNFLKASGVYEFTKKAEVLKEYVCRVRRMALDNLKTYVIGQTNQRVRRFLPNDRIVIRKIDNSLHLDGKDGASEGQTLAVAYAYIGTLFEHSRFEFPFIVDSPAAPMDLDVRREVAGVLPELFAQTVIFVTSGERRGFADTFFRRDDVQYLTIEGSLDEPAKLHEGKQFFAEYQERE